MPEGVTIAYFVVLSEIYPPILTFKGKLLPLESQKVLEHCYILYPQMEKGGIREMPQ